MTPGQMARTKRFLNAAEAGLATAGVSVIATREDIPVEHQALVTAMRDQITEMIADVKTLRELALGKG